MTENKLKVVYIDWYKTLSSSRFFVNKKDPKPELCQICRHRTFVENEPLLIPWKCGRLFKQDILQAISKNKKEYDAAYELLKSSCENMCLDSEKYLPQIERLRSKGIKVVIATDNFDVFSDYVVPSMGLKEHFDGIISSHQVGCMKNEVRGGRLRFFEESLKNFGADYHQALMLDDLSEVVDACNQNGLRAKRILQPQDLELELEAAAE